MSSQNTETSKLIYNHEYGYITQEEQNDMDVIDDMKNIYRVPSLEEFINIETENKWINKDEEINSWGLNRDEIKALIRKHLPKDVLKELSKLKKKEELYVYNAMEERISHKDLDEYFKEIENKELEELIKEHYSEDNLFVSDLRMDIHVIQDDVSYEILEKHRRESIL